LVAAGHQVVATTRTSGKVEELRALGADPMIMDGLDPVAVGEAVARAEPEVVIHQMTSLVGMTNLRHFDREFAATNQLRRTGIDHLLAAAVAAGARRFIAQSYTGWPNVREGGAVKTELDPLDPNPPAAQRQSLAAIDYLERTVLAASEIDGVVLRYGSFYGPGVSAQFVELIRKRRMPLTGRGTGIWSWLHIEDAAAATVAAVDHGEPGIYNIVDDEPAPVSQWLPYLAEAVGAKPPHRIPVWLARVVGGNIAVSMLTQIRGSSNAKAQQQLHWQPVWPSWRDGFRRGLTEEAQGSVSPVSGS
jgi:nucleoside-diphosphate-sugar epimerase